MREISNEKAFLEMAEAVFQERKEKLEEIKRHEEEKTKIREEKIARIAKICLEIFSESTKNTESIQNRVTEIHISLTNGNQVHAFCTGLSDEMYGIVGFFRTPEYMHLKEKFLNELNKENLNYFEFWALGKYFGRTGGKFYTKVSGDDIFPTLTIGISE